MTTRIAPGVGANLLGQQSAEGNQDATAYVGNLDPQVTEELLWMLFDQTRAVVKMNLLKDRVTNLHHGYGFVEFRSEEDVDNAIKNLNRFPVYDKPIRVNKTSESKKRLDVGANLFVGNLDPDVDEKLMYDTFSAFGVIATNPKITRDPETGNSRGFGFISYDSFEASDAAIDSMNGQYLCNRQITVSYAYKKDTKGERHGTPAERTLARGPPTLAFPVVPPPPGVAPPQWQKQQMGQPQGMPPQHLQQFRKPKPSIPLPPSNMKVQMMNIPLPLQASAAAQMMNIPPPQAGIAGTLVYYSICYPESS